MGDGSGGGDADRDGGDGRGIGKILNVIFNVIATLVKLRTLVTLPSVSKVTPID